jgi:hypothetical protein
MTFCTSTGRRYKELDRLFSAQNTRANPATLRVRKPIAGKNGKPSSPDKRTPARPQELSFETVFNSFTLSGYRYNPQTLRLQSATRVVTLNVKWL